MAVFTEVSFDEAAQLIDGLGIGALRELKPCAGGIENTNYFVDTTAGRYVLTLFERLTAEELPFYLQLMKHLADRGLPVPGPHADASGSLLLALKGKPAAVVDRLPGEHHLAPDAADCASLGTLMAGLHLAAADFTPFQPNLRGLAWWTATVPTVLPHLEPRLAALMEDELQYQQHLAESPAHAALPRGPIHGDLFRDNVMFERQAARRRVRLLLRRRRLPAVRHRRGPQRLVHRHRVRAASPRTGPRRWWKPMRACVRWRAPRSACCRR